MKRKIKSFIILIVVITICYYCVPLIYKRIRFEQIYPYRFEPEKKYLDNINAFKTMQKYLETNFDSIYNSSIKNEYSPGVTLHNYDSASSYKGMDLFLLNYSDTINPFFLHTRRIISNYLQFYRIKCRKNIGTKDFHITLKRFYLEYKEIPTYHEFIFDTKKKYGDPFVPGTRWYFYAYDDKESDLYGFLDPTPQWLRLFIEANDFFKAHPDKLFE